MLKRLSVDALLGDLGLSCWTQAGGTSTGQNFAMDQSGGLVDHQLLFRGQNPNSWTTSEGRPGDTLIRGPSWTHRQSVLKILKCLIFMATRSSASTRNVATSNSAPPQRSTWQWLHSKKYPQPAVRRRLVWDSLNRWARSGKRLATDAEGDAAKAILFFKKNTVLLKGTHPKMGTSASNLGVPNVPTPYPDLPEPAQSCKRLTCWKSLKLPSQPGGHSISLRGLLLTVQFLFAAVRSLPVAVRNASTSICSSVTSTGKSCLPDSRHRTSYDILCG